MNNNYLKSNNIIEKNIEINGIPAILMTPVDLEGKRPTVIIYHGWSSSKEFQRLRGFILASVGFQVLMPDAMNHGERDPLDVYNLENARKNFWGTVSKNIEESDSIIEGLINDYQADSKRIGLLGHSMGGFSVAGIFTKHQNINSLVVLNGSCDWDKSNALFTRNLFKEDEDSDVLEIPEGLKEYNPIGNMDNINDRPMLLLHGITDSLVPIDAQDSFYETAKMSYKDASKLKYIRYNNLNHFVTTNMMEESINWFKKYM